MDRDRVGREGLRGTQPCDARSDARLFGVAIEWRGWQVEYCRERGAR